MASTSDAAFILGGYNDDGYTVDRIVEFRDNKWTLWGTLSTVRRLHGSISSGDETMVIGGDGNES